MQSGQQLDRKQFASDWEAGWNSHDLDRILSHYSDDVVFRSRKAVDLVGSGEIKGKAALREYWGRALEKQPDLKFAVQNSYLGHDIIVITYLNHKNVQAAETLRFDASGLVVEASASHAV